MLATSTERSTAPTELRLVGVMVVWLASIAVLVGCLLASFRLGFATDIETLIRVNGPRVVFGAAVGGLLALSGSIRLAADVGRPLRELEILAVSSGAAAGGFSLAQHRSGAPALLLFAAGAMAGAFVLDKLVRALDRPARWTNLAIAAVLAGMAGTVALVGTYARARRDFVAPVVTWLLGDLDGTSFASGLALLGTLVVLVIVMQRRGAYAHHTTLGIAAAGLAVGAAGPLAFVGTLAPRAVRWLAKGASNSALLATSVVAGAATVVAVDAVPRLLLGGYDFPWNLPAAMLAIPIFLGWNRTRLRRHVGPARLGFEVVEVGIIVGMTLAGAWLASVLTAVIRSAT